MTFAYPIIFIIAVALIPLMLLWAYRVDRGKQKQLGKFLAPTLIMSLTDSVSPRKILWMAVLLSIGIALFVIAVARPQYCYVWLVVKSK